MPPRRFNHCLLLLLLGCHGCQESPDTIGHELRDEGAANLSAAPATLRDAIADRVWVSTDTTNPPGEMRIFLSDGTLVSDSCWETYRLSRWRMESDGNIVWREDTADIKAAIIESNDSTLVLRLGLIDGIKLERYTTGSAPYVCPDLPR